MFKIELKYIINITEYVLLMVYMIITISYVSQIQNINQRLYNNPWEIAETINILLFLIITIIKIIFKPFNRIILILFSFYELCLFTFKITVNFTILNTYETLILMSFLRMINLYLYFSIVIQHEFKTGRNNNMQPLTEVNHIDNKIKAFLHPINFLDNNNQSINTMDNLYFLDELSVIYNNNNHISDKYLELNNELNKMADIDFNVFKISSLSNNMELLVVMNHLFHLYKMNESLNIDSKFFKNYFYLVNINYRKNAYHNSIHGCDVTQTMYFIIKTCNIDTICNLSDIDIFCCYFASSIHDVDHPGNNNNYEIAVESPIAISYNDKAVLENYHLFKAFSLLKTENCDVFSNFSVTNYTLSRRIIISMVLSTDMANHFSDLNNLKIRIKSEDYNPQTNDKQILLNSLIHSSDISNPIKPIDIYTEWVKRVFIEFYIQGDKEREKGLKISFLCDRFTVNIPDAQIGFIDGIVFPLFDALSLSFPNMKMINNLIINNKEEFKKYKEIGKKIL